MRRLLIAAAASVLSLTLVGVAQSQEAPATITGVVFHDLDGDGVQDLGEPGLPGRDVTIDGGGREVTNEEGVYRFGDVAPGEHTVSVQLVEVGRPCVGPPPDVYSFEPIFPRSFCVDVANPWRATTPDSAPVNAVAGATAEVDFGLQPVDMVTMAGYAILEDDFAPVGTVIDARFDGTECGRAEMRAGGNMQIDVFGAGERPGCPRRDDLVGFLIGGEPAAGEVRWVPFTETSSIGGFFHIGLVAIEHHAWYWTQSVVDVPPPDGTTVQAVVGGTVCGEATTRSVPIGQGSSQYLVGFSRLIVPSLEIAFGCGRPDAAVSFRMGGEEVGTIAWQTGLQEVTLRIEASVMPTVVLPSTGSGGQREGASPWVWPLGLGALVLGGGGLLLRRRRPA